MLATPNHHLFVFGVRKYTMRLDSYWLLFVVLVGLALFAVSCANSGDDDTKQDND
jgi:hypothetical protein